MDTTSEEGPGGSDSTDMQQRPKSVSVENLALATQAVTMMNILNTVEDLTPVLLQVTHPPCETQDLVQQTKSQSRYFRRKQSILEEIYKPSSDKASWAKQFESMHPKALETLRKLSKEFDLPMIRTCIGQALYHR